MALVVIVFALAFLFAGAVVAGPRLRARLRREPVWWQDFERAFRQYVAEQERSAR